jgi:hypothetical protein
MGQLNKKFPQELKAYEACLDTNDFRAGDCRATEVATHSPPSSFYAVSILYRPGVPAPLTSHASIPCCCTSPLPPLCLTFHLVTAGTARKLEHIPGVLGIRLVVIDSKELYSILMVVVNAS